MTDPQATATELLPCPFCGNDEPVLEKVSAGSRLSAVFCNTCEISGEKMSSPEAAIAAWNTRPNQEATPCTMGVGCDEAGVCYAEAHGEPERCPKEATRTVGDGECDHYKMVSGGNGPWTCVRCGAVDPERPKYGKPRTAKPDPEAVTRRDDDATC